MNTVQMNNDRQGYKYTVSLGYFLSVLDWFIQNTRAKVHSEDSACPIQKWAILLEDYSSRTRVLPAETPLQRLQTRLSQCTQAGHHEKQQAASSAHWQVPDTHWKRWASTGGWLKARWGQTGQGWVEQCSDRPELLSWSNVPATEAQVHFALLRLQGLTGTRGKCPLTPRRSPASKNPLETTVEATPVPLHSDESVWCTTITGIAVVYIIQVVWRRHCMENISKSLSLIKKTLHQSLLILWLIE